MKAKNKRYRSDAFAAIHEAAEALYRVGAIDKVTMREFDETCLEVLEDIPPDDKNAVLWRNKERT